MYRATRFAAAAVIATGLLLPASATAHEGEGGRIFALGDHVTPGQPFEIIGIEIEPKAVLALELANGSTTVELGGVTTGEDGTFTVSAIAPASFPLGYATLTATSVEPEVHVETFVLVGEQALETPPADPADTQGIDTRTIGLVVLVVGLVIFAVGCLRYLRR